MAWVQYIYRFFKRDKRGITSLDYALIAAIMGTVIVVNVAQIGRNLSTEFASLAGKI
jgi:Flp pilus assembly pilin Flp